MRRLISYVTLCSAMLLGTAAVLAPTVINMNTDAAYRDGKTFTFRISENFAEAGDNIEYDPAEERIQIEDEDSIKYVAKEFRNRLDNWGLSSYQIDTLGKDTIKVTLRANSNDATEYSYVQKYLTFSGENYELDASMTTGTDYVAYDSLTSCLDYENSWIEYIEQSGVASFPVVIVPLEDPTGTYDTTTIYQDFKDLISYCNANTQEADEEAGTEAKSCSLVIWANRKSTDVFSNAEKDSNVASRIFAAEATGNDNAIFYKSNDADKETPYLQLIPSSAALSQGQYDATKASEAYSAARFYNNCFHACAYENEGKSLMVTYLYSEDADASVENLFSYYWNQSIAWGATLIASLVAFALVAIVLVVFEKLYALQIMSVTALTVYGALAAFIGFGAQFNIATLFGLLLVGIVTIFQGLSYSHKVKDELYKGRTIKKAHQEAVKKATLVSVDSSVISIILGVFVFFFAGDVVAKAGTVLVAGGFFALVLSNFFNRVLGWMISTDATAQAKFPVWFNVDKTKIPDLLKEEKQTFFGTYDKKDFAKGKKISLFATLAFIAAGIATMIAFGVKNDGNVFNTKAYTTSQTVLTLEVKSTSSETNTNKIDNITDFIEYDGDAVKTTSDTILNKIKLADGRYLSEVTEEVTTAESGKTIYNAEDEMSYGYYYFNVTLDGVYGDDDDAYEVNGVKYNTLVTAFEDAIEDYSVSKEDFIASVKTLSPETGVPALGKVYLGIGLGVAVSAVYMVIRFGFGKGLTASVISAGASYACTSIFTLARISTTPIVALGAVAAPIFVFMFAIAMFNKANEIVKESREKEKETLEFKLAQIEVAANRSATEIIYAALVAAYALVAYFAFGPRSYANVYLNAIFALVFAIALALTLLPSFAVWASKMFSHINIKLPERKKKKLGQLQSNKKSSEPEEAIFIGIND